MMANLTLTGKEWEDKHEELIQEYFLNVFNTKISIRKKRMPIYDSRICWKYIYKKPLSHIVRKLINAGWSNRRILKNIIESSKYSVYLGDVSEKDLITRIRITIRHERCINGQRKFKQILYL